MQDSVTTRFVEAVEGMLSDNSMIKDCLSRVNAEASAEIPFAVMVKQGTDPHEVLKLTAITNKLAGIVVFNHSYAKPNELGETGLKPKTAFNILNKGRIWVRTEEAVTQASAVRVRAIATGDEVAGTFRTTADANDCVDISKYARFMKAADADSLVELEIDMTNAAEGAPDA